MLSEVESRVVSSRMDQDVVRELSRDRMVPSRVISVARAKRFEEIDPDTYRAVAFLAPVESGVCLEGLCCLFRRAVAET